jgi:hypothetical protein
VSTTQILLILLVALTVIAVALLVGRRSGPRVTTIETSHESDDAKGGD